VGVSYDTPEDNAAFVEKYRFPYKLLSDPDRSIARAYGAFNEGSPDYPARNTYVIGVDRKLEHVLEGVNPKTSPRDILDSLS
jgi:peroxiredoxin Q/BCP